MGEFYGWSISFFNEEWHMGLNSLVQENNVLKCWLVYKTKFTCEGVVERHEACFVANGFS